MSEYTPTTKDVREVWIYEQDITHGEGDDFHGAEFDRWLAAHDAEVRQEQADHDAIRINDLDTRLVAAERELAEARAACEAGRPDHRTRGLVPHRDRMYRNRPLHL